MHRTPSGPTAAAATPAPTASVDVATVRQRFNFDWATHQEEFTEVDTYWWWATSIRIDPDEVWAEDEEGDLWVVPFTTDGVDTVTFATPVRSRLTAVPVTAADGQAASAVVSRRRQQVAAANLDRPEKPGRNQAAALAGPDTERIPMDANVLQALAREHGLDPETATEEQVNAAVIAAVAADAAEATTTTVAEVEVTPEAGVTPPEPALAAAATAGSASEIRAALGLPGTASDTEVRAAITEMQEGARAGANLAAEQVRTSRDQLIEQAVRDGRIAPSASEAWRGALDRQPEAEAAALAALPPGRVPVDALRGSAASAETGGITTTGWFSQLKED